MIPIHKPRISIVMTYWNRPEQLQRTLASIDYFNAGRTDLLQDIIIVDDASKEAPLADLDLSHFQLPITCITIEKKKHINPCIAFNLGFQKAQGDIVLIQNSECLHFSNILDYLQTSFHENDYVSFSCYSLSKDSTAFHSINSSFADIQFQQRSVTQDGQDGWYNHSRFRPTYYHFAAAIHRKNLQKLGGFDPRYQFGYGYDDDEFLFRIRSMGLHVSIQDDLSVIHQWHPNSGYFRNLQYFKKRNHLLLTDVTYREKKNKIFRNLILLILFRLKCLKLFFTDYRFS